MRKCYLLLLLPVVFGTRPPAAVFEDVFELGRPNIAFLASPINQNGMQAYLSKRNRQLADYTMATSGSRYHYHTAASERYQHYEESQHDRIRLENLQKIANVRTKRLDSIAMPRQSKKVDIIPREVFRFTLADAMVHQENPERLGKSKKIKRSVNREESRSGKRVEPVPSEILWFELKDAITQKPVTSIVEEGNVHHRRKRSADPGVNKEGREIVSFELQDAKTVDRDTKPFNKQLKEEKPNLRMPFMTSDIFKRGSVYDEVAARPDSWKRDTKNDKRDSPQDDPDMSIEESRRVKVTRGNKKKMANYEDLPLGVQKAIDIAIKENERMNSKPVEDSTRPPKYYFGDKKPKTKKPFSSTTSTKVTFQSPKDTKFSPSPQVETGFVPSKSTKGESSENLKPEKATNATWWAVSNLNRPKRLYQKPSYPPLVVNPQYINTYKPTMETYKMTELSPGYQQSQENSYEYEAPKEVVIQEKPKIQYVIKEVPVPARMKESRTKITVQPTISISYDKEPSAPASSQESNQPEYNNPYGPVELQYEQPKEVKTFHKLKIVVPDSKEQSQPSYYHGNHVEQHHFSESSHSDESYEKTGSSIAALSALIGKRPTVQLKGLNELLHMPVPIGNAQPLQMMKTRVRPQDSTAPIMFPMESSTPPPTPPRKTTGYRSVKIENGPKIVYEDSPNPSTLYHTVQMNPQLKVPMTKDYTPIKEVVSDISDSDLVGPTISAPTHATYIIGPTPVAPTVESNSYESDANSHESASYQQIQAIHTTPETKVEPIGVQYQTIDPGNKQHSHYHHQHQYQESHEDHEHHHYHHDHHQRNAIHTTPETIVEPISVQYQTGDPGHKYHSHYHHQQHYEDSHEDHEHHHHDDSEDNDDSEGYAFGYRVRDFHTGNDFGHIQNRDNGVTRGEYHILLPDGRVQNVRYTADEKGFHADVSYESVPTPHESSPSSSSSSSSSSSPSSSSTSHTK